MIKLNDVGTLIASVPPMIGFPPTNSLVVLGVTEGRVSLTLRTDLPEPDQYIPVALQLASAIANHRCDGAILIVFGGSTTKCNLPHTSLVSELEKRLSARDMRAFGSYWAAEAAAGAAWGCYCGDASCDRAGALPDPAETVIAATVAAEGHVTLASRDELADFVRPAADVDLLRRAEMIERQVLTWSRSSAAGFALVRAAVAEFAKGQRALDDESIVGLSLALQDKRVRDAALSFAAGDDAAAGEALFLALTRECPSPHRAEAAVLAAFYTYLRGDGALASVVLDATLTTRPDHQFALLLRTALNAGIPNAVLAQMVRSAVIWSEQLLTEQDAAPLQRPGADGSDRVA